MTDYAEEQRNEIEALESIYPDEIEGNLGGARKSQSKLICHSTHCECDCPKKTCLLLLFEAETFVILILQLLVIK